MWSEDEDQSRLIKNPCLTRPKLHEHIRAWNTHGEQYSGEIIQHHAWKKREFKIKEHETAAELWVDLNKMNQWEYIDNPRIEIEAGKLELPSGPILHSGTIYTEEYMQFYCNYLMNDETYYVNFNETYYNDYNG